MMEDLLTPQICMDVDDTPYDVGKNYASDDEVGEANEREIDDDEKVKMLLETEFNDPSQVPDDLTDFEKDARKNVFAIGEPAVQFQRLHCTACNAHLGSAPIGHFNRYIHPLLKVLLCKACYEFYRSGDFDKDEDGSEMYCRWCGQGGKVMCCAQCAFVFCQKCVRQNLGRKILELIKDSDDWMCFGCSPTQLINLKIICTSLFEFVQEEIRLAKALNNAERLKIDHSVCCQKTKTQPKRKRDDDTTYNPATDWEDQIKVAKKAAPSILKQTLTQPPLIEETPIAIAPQPRAWDSQDEDEVVCTPDLASLMEEEDKQTLIVPSLAYHVPVAPMQNNSPTTSKPLSTFTMSPLPRPIRPDGNRRLHLIAPKMSPITFGNLNNRALTCNNNIQQPLNSNSNFVRLQTPAIKFVAQQPIPGSRTVIPPVVNASPAHIIPGLRHEWFEKAASIVSTITGNLSTTLVYLTKEQKTAKTVEQLATVHNKLQELLSTSVNSLIQVRKNLRNEFLNDLNKLKFTESPSPNSNTNYRNNVKPNVKPITCNNEKVIVDDDDVILINSDSLPKSKPMQLKTMPGKDQPRPYLKVRSVSQLLRVPSECITIPDDPPPLSLLSPMVPITLLNDDDVSIIEKDPLSLSPHNNAAAETPQIVETETEILPTNPTKENSTDEGKSRTESITDGAETSTNESESTKANMNETGPKERNNDQENICKPIEETNESVSVVIDEENDLPKNIELDKDNNAQPNDLTGCDEVTHLMIKNALAESKIDLLLQENSKYVMEDIPPDELQKVLSVRVVLATKYQSDLPKNRLKTADWFTEDIEAILSGNILIRHSIPEVITMPHDSEENIPISSESGDLTVKNEDSKIIENEETRQKPDPGESSVNDVEINEPNLHSLVAESANVIETGASNDSDPDDISKTVSSPKNIAANDLTTEIDDAN